MSNLDSKKRKSNLLHLLVLFIFFLFFIVSNKENLFQKFNPEVVSRYLRSQDIFDSEDEIKDRVFVSDADIYISAGYLYTNGEDPRSYNFQHPPFVKYLFGYSSKFFNLPFLPNIFFAGIFILEVYLLGKLLFKSEIVGLLSSILLMFDPVFKEVVVYALLDLGQMIFILGFLITTFFYKKNYIIQGVLLGLACASKFYSPVVIFLGIIYLYKFYTKNLNFRRELLVLFFAFLTFLFSYVVSFKNESGLFNIFFHQAKIIKFMLDHNQAVEWGGVLKMFFGGYFVWPILFFVNLYLLFKTKLQDIKFLFILVPLIYLLIMCFQIPFTRYFILLLPFFYLNLTYLLLSLKVSKDH